jgi:DNA-binding Lrp family transcriptional regulator
MPLGRDRDPFDRTVAYLRERLAAWRPLQGAVISINGLAQTLDVSHTPVREALAMLTGEGLIVRTAAGYAGATHAPETLGAHYDLAELLVARAVTGLPAEPWPEMPGAGEVLSATEWLDHLVEKGGDVALRAAYRRVAGQLTPFVGAAEQVLNDGPRAREGLSRAWRANERRALAAASRAYHARRRRAATRILTSALGLGTPP